MFQMLWSCDYPFEIIGFYCSADTLFAFRWAKNAPKVWQTAFGNEDDFGDTNQRFHKNTLLCEIRFSVLLGISAFSCVLYADPVVGAVLLPRRAAKIVEGVQTSEMWKRNVYCHEICRFEVGPVANRESRRGISFQTENIQLYKYHILPYYVFKRLCVRGLVGVQLQVAHVESSTDVPKFECSFCFMYHCIWMHLSLLTYSGFMYKPAVVRCQSRNVWNWCHTVAIKEVHLEVFHEADLF